MNVAANAKYGSGYEVPDWMRQNFGLGFTGYDSGYVNDFFNKNPALAQDFQNIASGGKSQFATDGSSLVKTNLNAIPQDVANHYRSNPDELLAAEGFGFDPTLAYQAYYNGPGAVGVNPKNGLVSDALRNNKWTPQGMVANNNTLMYSNTPWGAGTSSLRGGTGTTSGTPSGKPAASGYGGYGGTAGAVGFTQQPGMNPYLQQALDATANTTTQNWQNTVKPALASQAMAAGGYGGSRQGVIESNSANDLNQGLSNALANLAFTGYNAGLNYDLGLRNNALGFGNLDRNINNDNIANQMQGAQLGLNIWDRLMNNNQMGLNAGNSIQNTPLNYWQQFSNSANGIGSNFNTNTSSTNVNGNPLLNAAGGAQLGSQIGQWWNGGNSGYKPDAMGQAIGGQNNWWL